LNYLELKIKKISEIAKSYITKDLTDIFGADAANRIDQTAIYLSQNIGNLLSKENISKTIGISTYKVNAHLDILIKSFIINTLNPFYKNPIKEVSHRPKVYFLDNGLRNVLINKTSPQFITNDIGKLFEQTVWQILETKFNSRISYWRNINQTEVDFIIKETEKVNVIETKYSFNNKTTRNLESFKENYKNIINKSFLITKDNFISLF